jgi:hypothetical protein
VSSTSRCRRRHEGASPVGLRQVRNSGMSKSDVAEKNRARRANCISLASTFLRSLRGRYDY